jgi:hypothetical protein
VLFSTGGIGSADGENCMVLARAVIASWITNLIREGACRRIVELSARARAETAQYKLELRRSDLTNCPYVYYKHRRIYRAPTNENQLVALFLKLESCGALPFDCQVLEYTPKSGIDAIGHFRLGNDRIRELYAPIEFEHEFSSFIEHGHPVRHTKLIVCWSCGDSRGKQLKGSRSHSWLKYYSAEGCKVPVVVVSKIPNIEIERPHDTDPDS